jgi:hypothetical protein
VALRRSCLFCPRTGYFIFLFKHFTRGIIFNIRDALIYIFNEVTMLLVKTNHEIRIYHGDDVMGKACSAHGM